MPTEKRITRKSFLRNFVIFLREAAENDLSSSDFLLLPPGVNSERAYIEQCTECYKCVSVCPHLSLRVCHDEQSPFVGKPYIDPAEQPCYLCNDLPCVTVCEPGALQKEFANRLNGVARIDTTRCLSFNGLFCQTCVNVCPLINDAITVDQTGHPEMHEENCVGCGICLNQCPVDPPAISMKRKN